MADMPSNSTAQNSQAEVIAAEREADAQFQVAVQHLKGVLHACHSEEERLQRMTDFVKNPQASAGGGAADNIEGLARLTVEQRYAVAQAVFAADKADSEL
ncbi:hypothetical protein MN608_09954 [Microdochium nivale]|nr:hypothetical protein MN608_09954 [Microdochium nivale]